MMPWMRSGRDGGFGRARPGQKAPEDRGGSKLLAAAVGTGSANCNTQPLIVIHFDVNETIMVGDPAGGDTFEESLNKVVCKSAFCKKGDPDTWHTGDPVIAGDAAEGLAAPPLHTGWEWPPGCAPIYRTLKERDDKVCFTERRGFVYRPFLNRLVNELKWPDSEPVVPELCHDGTHHFLIPAFFQTIATLTAQKRRFRIVIRTFGTDTSQVARAMTAFAQGKHYLHAGLNVPSVALSDEACYQGRYAEDGTFTLTDSAGTVISDENQVIRLVNGDVDATDPTVIAIQDDYKWWKKGSYHPSGGKPLWVTGSDANVHHIFFDDNIHNDPEDSIVAARHRQLESDPFRPLSGAETLGLQGTHLVRVPTLEPILDHDWFVKQIEMCEDKFRKAHKL